MNKLKLFVKILSVLVIISAISSVLFVGVNLALEPEHKGTNCLRRKYTTLKG